jgi:TonB family protein
MYPDFRAKFGPIASRDDFVKTQKKKKNQKKKKKIALTPFSVSIIVHSLFFLGLLLEIHDHPRSTTLTPVELVGSPSTSASKASGHSRPPQAEATPLKSSPQVQAETNSAPPEAAGSNSGSPSDHGGATGSEGPAGSPLQLYIAQVVYRIDQAKVYPEDALSRGEEGQIVVSLQVLPDGLIRSFHLAEPCPFESLNHAALDTIARVKRLPPLPDGRTLPLSIRIPLNFELSRR